MTNHFITEIYIEKIRHLENIKINLSSNEARHLLLTGKNGSGKTTVLEAIKKNLRSISGKDYASNIKYQKNRLRILEEELNKETNEDDIVRINAEIKEVINSINVFGVYGLDIKFNTEDNVLESLYIEGKFVLAYYDSKRFTNVEIPKGVEKINLKDVYTLDDKPREVFLKYLVDLKTQQSFARNEEDIEMVNNIDGWFNKLENALKEILEDESIKLKFDYRNYDFKILQKNREPYSFNELSDGYSSILSILSDLILRLDKNRASSSSDYSFDTEGIVLIDEIETHLHIGLQKKILLFLTEFFPNIQFIVSTHSPFVLNSINNAIIYDLEKNIRVEGLSDYSYEGIVEGYFEIDNYSNELKAKINQYRELAFRKDLSDDEKAFRAELRIELKNASNDLAKELKEEFNEIEQKRKSL